PRVAGVAVLVTAPVAVAAVLFSQRGADYLHRLVAERATAESGGRSGGVQAALDLIAYHPVIGSGVGEARFFWISAYGNAKVSLYAHDEYLQVLVDLGAVGAVLLLALFAALAVTLRRGRGLPHRPGVRAGAIAAVTALAVHSGFDFLWHLAVIPLAGALLVGLAGPAIRNARQVSTVEGEE